MNPLNVFKLGIIPYDQALSFQFELVERVKESKGKNSFLILLEHSPVITMGKNAIPANLLVSPETLKQRKIELKKTDRGGDVTYHGPGQLVGYPILQLSYHKKTVREYVRLLEQTIIRTLSGYGITAYIKDDKSAGVWACPAPRNLSGCGDGDAKIGFIGMRVSKGITYHGFSFNVNNDLDTFELMNPCGMKNPKITSLSKLLGKEVAMNEVIKRYLDAFRELFKVEITEVKTHLSYIPEEIPS